MADNIDKGLHGCSREEQYVRPTDPLIQQRLEWFQDQKLALMMHFGVYSELGCVESWPLSDDDADWARGFVDWESDPDVFRQQYADLKKSFNPICIRPELWADIAARNGFKYLIFTTKHHDGFCLFDTQYTDYKSTSLECPFHTHKHANIVKDVFDAFRARGLGIAAYFSKPDWHCPWYWAEGMEKPVGYWRNPTYVPAEHPELWNKFVEFTHNQMMELVRDYGPIDILWLDGGQVGPQNGQDIRLSEFMKKARQIKPDLLVADRTIGGENENYITPESSIPSVAIHVPWESCIPAGGGYGYGFDPQFRSPRQLVNMLIDVVCRGGNLALNVAPQPNGKLPRGGIRALDGLGAWLRANGEAIYGTRMADPNECESVAFTKKGDVHYALLRLPEGEPLKDKLLIPWPHQVTRLTLLDIELPMRFERVADGLLVDIPHIFTGTSPIAPVFRMEP